MYRIFALLFSLTTDPIQVAISHTQVDVELLLAVDVSGSMDIEEARTQRQGYVDALQHPDFIDAVKGGMLGRIAIGYFEWAGAVNVQSVVNWQVIDDAEDAKTFAEKVDKPVRGSRRGTSLSNAILFGTESIEANAFSGNRRVLDVSGDGPNNTGPPVSPIRNAALKRGIVINGLAILIRPSATMVALDQYYSECVVGGPGSFMLPVTEPEDFAIAIRQKLILEVSGLTPQPTPIPAASGATVDCSTGIMLQPNTMDRTSPSFGK
ncbi:DUF1194 domain-containing protein [Sinorhizobium meliloti]|uniref:DUF1194 domain-containing protein n=1 Tax=Rhizobium meliloti TaxID=382 RepID=UPI0002A55DAD|nr:DUF1194 domain-containing protein [Sinorhizobium meliloti]AGA11064.1 Protein of unknown function (DUF1194) [Sinorhizobium meliloti GR4]RVL04589.1 DUF1194 domain-containing protein [Sinorhizobium meliloti]RVM93325.1 DUF1194 domain-containing protein [Sinorhizobium meliloti]RVN10350.1 DUF1194 domain-containing protein [Sinorhizobium meliloti]